KRIRLQVEIFATCPNSSAIGPIRRTSRRIRAISLSLKALGSNGTMRIDSWIATLSFRSCTKARTDPKSLWLTRYSKPSIRTTGRSLASMKCSIAIATFSGGLGRIAFFSVATRLSHRTGVGSKLYSAITAFGPRQEDLEEELADGAPADPDDDQVRVPPDLLARLRLPEVGDEPVGRVEDEGDDRGAVDEQEVPLELDLVRIDRVDGHLREEDRDDRDDHEEQVEHIGVRELRLHVVDEVLARADRRGRGDEDERADRDAEQVVERRLDALRQDDAVRR